MLYKLIVNYNNIEKVEFKLPDYPKTIIIGRSTQINPADIPIKAQTVSRNLAEIKCSLINGLPFHSVSRSPSAANKFRRKEGEIYKPTGDYFVLKDKDIFLISNTSIWIQYLIQEEGEDKIEDENETYF